MTNINPTPSQNERSTAEPITFPMFVDPTDTDVPSEVAALANKLNELFDPQANSEIVLAIMLVSAGLNVACAATMVDSANRITFHLAQNDETWAITSFLRYPEGAWNRLAWIEPREDGESRPAFTVA